MPYIPVTIESSRNLKADGAGLPSLTSSLQSVLRNKFKLSQKT